MDSTLIKFNYYDHVDEAYNASGFLYADVPSGISSMLELLKFYETDKYITNWHDYNFNAFHDGISAVEYYPASLNKIIHHDLPKLEDSQKTYGYIRTLNRVIQELEVHRELKKTSKPPYAAELRVYFPRKFKDTIETLFKSYGLNDYKKDIYSDPQLVQEYMNWAKDVIDSGEWKKWRKSVGLPEQPE